MSAGETSLQQAAGSADLTTMHERFLTERTRGRAPGAGAALLAWLSASLSASLFASLLASLFVIEAAVGAPADANSEPGPLTDTPTTAAIRQLALSDALADFAERTADPVAFIEAAKIRKLLPPPLNGDADSSEDARTWQTLLTRALQLGGSNPAVASLAADLKHLKVRDIPIIPLTIKLLHKQIKQNAADRAEVRFKAGELAVVYVHPLIGVELEFYVYDDLNNLICVGGSAAGQGSECRWRPRHDGSFLIDVRNNTAGQVDYDLAINRESVPR